MYERNGKNLFWSFKNSDEIITKGHRTVLMKDCP